MDVTALLGTVLGLAVAYWILATACSFLLEVVNSLSNVRGRALTRYIGEMLGDVVATRSFRKQLYDSVLSVVRIPIILWNGLGFLAAHVFGFFHQLIARIYANLPPLPAWVTTQLNSTQAVPAIAELTGTAKQLYTHPLVSSLNKPTFRGSGPSTFPSYIPAGTFATALIDVLRGPAPKEQTLTYRELADRVAALQTSNLPSEQFLGRALAPLIDNVHHDLAEARLHIEQWYDGVMDRATGWYKRRAMVMLGVVGFIAAAALNIDSIGLARQLLASADLRNEFTLAAEKIREDEVAAAAAVRSAASGLVTGKRSLFIDRSRPYDEMRETEREDVRLTAKGLLASNVKGNTLFSAAWVAAEVTEAIGLDRRKKSEGQLNRAELEKYVGRWGAVLCAIEQSRVTPEGVADYRCDPLDEGASSGPGADGVGMAAGSDVVTDTRKSLAELRKTLKSFDEQLNAYSEAQAKGKPNRQEQDRSVEVRNDLLKTANGQLGKLVAEFWSRKDFAVHPDLGRKIGVFLFEQNAHSLAEARDAVDLVAETADPLTRVTVKLLQPAVVTFGPPPDLDLKESTTVGEMANPFTGRIPAWANAVLEFLLHGFVKVVALASWILAFLGYLLGVLVKVITFQVPTLGWAITALMVSMGAPFWYDLIGKALNVRGAGGRPEPTGTFVP